MGEKDKKVCIPLFEISNSWYAKIFNIQTASDSVLNMKSRLVKLHIFKIYKKTYTGRIALYTSISTKKNQHLWFHN